VVFGELAMVEVALVVVGIVVVVVVVVVVGERPFAGFFCCGTFALLIGTF